MAVNLFSHQSEALSKMKNGCILCGGVGSGKSRTSIAYYYVLQGCDLRFPGRSLKNKIQDLYIITTARKRDTLEWERELAPFLLSKDIDDNPFNNKVVIDSWNNIKKYVGVYNAFFIFDEQRVVGSGSWVKSFLKITSKNSWILLSATPGDTWNDYIPVFVANGFYRNKTEFIRRHAIYNRYSKFPKIDRYIETKRLEKLRNDILVDMDFDRSTVPHHVYLDVEYDISLYKDILRNRWNYDKNCPVVSASELCYLLRKVVNSDVSRINTVSGIVLERRKVIVFYNYDYELDILKEGDYGSDTVVAEWNGHKHDQIPSSDSWVYLVQYTAGSEGWNCISTDTMIFYSQSYSYKAMVQAAGRIDRLNTGYKDLYYFHLRSKASIDLAISRALKNKKNFNERRFSGID